MEKTLTRIHRQKFDPGTAAIGTKIVIRIMGGKESAFKLLLATKQDSDASALRTVPFWHTWSRLVIVLNHYVETF